LLQVWLPLINIPDSQSVKWIQHHRSLSSIDQVNKRRHTETHIVRNKGNWCVNGECREWKQGKAITLKDIGNEESVGNG
jgi:hypothetical protein